MDNKQYRILRRQRDFLLICLIIFLMVFVLFYTRQQTLTFTHIKTIVHLPPDYKTPEPIQKMRIIGGFSADTAERIANASADGVQTIFYYGTPPTENSHLGQQIRSLHMNVVDGFISSNLYYYECQNLRAMFIPPYGWNTFCGKTSYPTFANEDAFLSIISAHLKQGESNSLIIGYWVLDDWILSDAGSAKPLLIKVHQLIQHYAPGRAAICGFGGNLRTDTTLGWSDQLADNFSPQGCDAVGLYVYSASQLDTEPLSSPQSYDWSMSKLLPAIFVSLQERGWNITKEPLIGIAQAFGGRVNQTNRYQVVPTIQDIQEQSKSFCEHGATGLTFYAWDDTGFGPTKQTPMNSIEIETGIRNGIEACKQHWNTQKTMSSIP